jgi:hypothetical protein
MTQSSPKSPPSPSTPQPFDPGLTKKLLLARGGTEQPKRITNEAVLVTGELLRIFVKEARHRANIEAECEKEGATVSTVEGSSQSGKILIRADHITKVAAELLMDFS